MFSRLAAYGRFVKVEHTLFSLPLLFSGAWLAGQGLPGWRLSGLIVAAGFGARTAAFAINRIIDRHLDRINPRTAQRELPVGRMNVVEAWAVGVFGTIVYVVAAWCIAPICLYLSPLPLLIFGIYPFLKRTTPLAHFGVGLADAMAPLGGWMAVRQSFEGVVPAFWLGLFTLLWVSGFDVIYATLDEDFDRRQGLQSFPSRYGKDAALRRAGFLHAGAFASLLVLYGICLRSPLSLLALFVIGGLLVLEHLWASDVDLAFFRINALIGFGVLGFIAAG
jgi:4-hydroxybenzoate polyprenyltransferase